MKRLLSILGALLAVAGSVLPGRAGDAATLDILGFSPNGKIFAFEEFGIQDGSGFPYANRFYIYTESDRFMEATPVRMLVKEDGGTLAVARNNARAKGEAIIEDTDLRANAGHTAGYNALTEEGIDPLRMLVRPRAIFPPLDEPIAFELEPIPFPAPESCKFMTEEIFGFRLTMTTEDGEERVLNLDESIPASRSCPLGYSIQAVQTFYPEEGAPVFAVLIAMRRVGFEGPDHRFLAVTGKL